MLIEGIGKFEIFEFQANKSIVKMIAVPPGTPLAEEDYLVCGTDGVIFHHSHILAFRTLETCLTDPKILYFKRIIPSKQKIEESSNDNFKSLQTDNFVCKTKQKLSLNYKLNQEINFKKIDDLKIEKSYPFEIHATDSIYHCTNALIEEDTIIFEFDRSEYSSHNILKELENINGKMIIRNQVYYLEYEPMESENEAMQIVYVIKCCDANIKVSFEVLNKKAKLVIPKKKFNHKLKGRNTKEFEYNHLLDQNKSHMKIKNIIFESYNVPGLSKLAKTYLKDCESSKYNFFKYALLQSSNVFYFIILKVNNTVTIIVSRKLYDFTNIFNILSIETKNQILKIPDLNFDHNSGSIAISQGKYKNLVKKFNIPKCFFNELLDMANQSKKVQLLSNFSHQNSLFNNSFWFIKAFQDQIYPFKFPGLILCPMLDEMEYLLNGPYPIIFSSNKNFMKYSKITVNFNDKINKNSTEKEKKPIENFWARRIEQINSENLVTCTSFLHFNGLNRKHDSKRNCFLSKTQYISLLLNIKKESLNKFPLNFHSSYLLEKLYLNEKVIFDCNYTYDIETEYTDFPQSARLNFKDSLSIWMMIFPGDLDLRKLLNTRSIDLGILCKRACFQKDIATLNSIIQKAEKHFLSKLKVKTIRFLFYKRQNLKSKKGLKMLISVLKSIENVSGLFSVTIDKSINITIEKPKRNKLNSTFIYKEQRYKLMKLKDILTCLQNNFITDRVIGSICAYLNYGNLPFPSESLNYSDTETANFTIYMNLNQQEKFANCKKEY